MAEFLGVEWKRKRSKVEEAEFFFFFFMPSKCSWRKRNQTKHVTHLARDRSSGCAISRERSHASCGGEEDGDVTPPRFSVEESTALAGIAATEDVAGIDICSRFLLPLSRARLSLTHSE